jgi:serine/threonine protein kinase
MNIYKSIKKHSIANALDSFCKKHNYSIDALEWLGKGDFGNAYLTPDKKVIKDTTDKKEYAIAQQLLNIVNGPFAKIYDAQQINNSYFMLQEYVYTDSRIEDLYNMAENYAYEQGEDVETVDIEDLEDEELKKFIDELQWIYDFQRRIGIMGTDIKPENLGYNADGELICFDISELSNMGHYR